MSKYYVNVSVKKFQGQDNKLLTYQTDQRNIARGSIVEVPFRNSSSLAVVYNMNKNKPKNIKQIKDVHRILPIKPLSKSLLLLANWLQDYYLATPSQIWTTILPSGLQVKRVALRKTAPKPVLSEKSVPIALNESQKKVIKEVLDNPTKPYLLHGVTGSGKTEVYLQLALNTLKTGKSVLILVPEISLTPQTTSYFQAHLNTPVILTHSKLTTATRRRIWLDILTSDKPQVVIGPRSAIFLPFSKLGLIIIDESHETSYKQDNGMRYNSIHVAARLAQINQATLVLGSATPSVLDYWLSTQDRLHLLELPNRAGKGKKPQVEIVKLDKKNDLLSAKLKSEISHALAQKKQIILFLNRRGSANAQICTNCGFVARCKRCDSSLSFHSKIGKLLCHVCNWQMTPPSICPDCNNDDTLIFIGAGTQKIETIIGQQFPEARIARLDGDTATLEHIFSTYSKMKQGEIDILIGTQMVARGLDLENVAFVGVLLADTSLAIPDFSAAERTFQLITQVVGRSGRKDNKGRAIIQTYMPKNPVIQAASEQNFNKFYDNELKHRANFNYPPFTYLCKATVYRKKSASSEKIATLQARKIRAHYPKITVLGPSQPLHNKSSRGFGWQLIIKSSSRRILLEIAKNELKNWTIDLDPITII